MTTTSAIRSRSQTTNMTPRFELPAAPSKLKQIDVVSPNADSLLRALTKRSARFDRGRTNGTASTTELLGHVSETIADAIADGAVERAMRSSILVRAALLNAGLSAATAWYEGLKLGIEKINEAHRKARAYGVRAHMARGLAQTLAIGAKHPDLPLEKVEQRAVAWARRLYLAQAAADGVHREGRSLPKDLFKRNERFEGLRKGIGLALALLSPLSGDQRRRLGQLVGRETQGNIDEGFRRLARPAVGADSIHATAR